MSVKTVSVERHFCDYCGRELTDADMASSFVTVHGPASYADSGSQVLFEWAPRGEYCRRHAEMLLEAVLSHLPVHDGYGRGKDTEGSDKAAELAMIEDECGDER